MKILIKKIKLINWRSHENTELEFDEGINVIMGRMGAGKSSITDAICFALFATFPNLQKKILKLDDILMKFPKEKRMASVELWFSVNGKNYYVKRVVEKGKGTTTSEFREDEKLIEAPKSNAVTKAIESVLGINYDLFTRAVYSEQNNIDYFLTLRPSERKKKIDELLMIDKFEKMRSAVVSLISKARERQNDRLRDINTMDESKLRQSVAKIRDEIKEISGRVEKLKLFVSGLEESIFENDKKLQKMKSEKEKADRIKNEISSKLGRVELLQKDIDSFKEYYDKLDEMKKALSSLPNTDELNENLEKIRKEIREMSEKLAELQKKFERAKLILENNEKKKKEKSVYEKELAKYEKKYSGVEKLEENIKSHEEKINEMRSKIGELRGKINEINDSIGKLRSSGSKCPVCGSPLTDEKKSEIEKGKIAEREKIENEMKSLNERMSGMTTSIEEMKRDLKVWSKIKSKIEMIEIVELKENPDDIKEKLDALESLIDEKRKEEIRLSELISDTKSKEIQLKNGIALAEKCKAKMDELSELKNEIEKLKSMKFEFDEKEFESVQEELRKLIGKKSEAEMEIKKDEEILNEKQMRIGELANEIDRIEKYKRDYQILVKMERKLKEFESALIKTQEQIRKKIVELVNKNMSAIWKEFYPYDEIQDIRLNATETDYKLELFNGVEWRSVEGIASGGERTSAAISLRIAMSISLVKQLKWLILDEPTHNLDDAAIDSFSFILREKLSSMINQIFIITHEEKLENAVTGSFYKLKKENGITLSVKEDIFT